VFIISSFYEKNSANLIPDLKQEEMTQKDEKYSVLA
jgi:hypothetical protein